MQIFSSGDSLNPTSDSDTLQFPSTFQICPGTLKSLSLPVGVYRQAFNLTEKSLSFEPFTPRA